MFGVLVVQDLPLLNFTLKSLPLLVKNFHKTIFSCRSF